MNRSAVLSDCGRYRYLLQRTWAPEKGTIAWIMLNPSTADAIEDDPTIRRCLQFTERLGRGELLVVNLFAYRTTDPRQLRQAADPVGSDTNRWIAEAIGRASIVVAGWGSLAESRIVPIVRAAVVVDLIRCQTNPTIWCLGKTRGGAPRHPLYVKSDAPLIVWSESVSRNVP